LQISLNELGFWKLPTGRPDQEFAVFAVVKLGGLQSRSATRNVMYESATGDCKVSLDTATTLPVQDDDPDQPISIEVHIRLKSRRPCAVVNVPLYCFGRSVPRKLRLPLWGASQIDELASMSVTVCFVQSWMSIFLNRKTSAPIADGPWQSVGHRPLREQFRESEALFREFEIFTNRFIYHCELWRKLVISGRRLAYWDRPPLTILCLLAITYLVVFLYMYILPMSLAVLLCVVIWQHPYFQGKRESWRSSGQLFWLPSAPAPLREGETDPSQGQFTCYENERRLMFGKFTPQRLRFYDMPNWCDAEGRSVEPPSTKKQWSYTVDVNADTDNDGWRYASHFGKNAVWRRTFQSDTYVRQRAYIGRCLNSSLVESQEPGKRDSIFRRHIPPTGFNSINKLPTSEVSNAAAIGGKGPEFGIAKTPYHDMYQQMLMRLAYLQRHVAVWMEYYERRKNLFFGRTLDTANIALIGVTALFIMACVVPTRFLLLFWTYGIFWRGLASGQLMRHNRDMFIKDMRHAAVDLGVGEDDSTLLAATWNSQTKLEALTDAGVQLLALRDWMRNKFFNGRPMVPLRHVQACGNLSDLAQLVIWTSDRFERKLKRWSPFTTLLEHVPTDVCLFKPNMCLVSVIPTGKDHS